MSLIATITVSGDPQTLREYRGEVNRLLDEEGGSFRELHTAERLEYEFRLQGGIPFPPFVSASQAFPEVTVEVRWSEAAFGRGGHAVIRNGVLAEQATRSQAPGGDLWNDVRAAADGGLEMALVCTRWHEFWHGYTISADQHAFFRIAGTERSCELLASDGIESEWAERWKIPPDSPVYTELVPREPIPADEMRDLDRIAEAFSREWVWFEESPPEETAVERARFAAYGYPVRPANLRSEKLRSLLRPEGGGFAFGSFGQGERWIPGLLRRCWLQANADGAA